jgi:hypothetical protein
MRAGGGGHLGNKKIQWCFFFEKKGPRKERNNNSDKAGVGIFSLTPPGKTSRVRGRRKNLGQPKHEK